MYGLEHTEALDLLYLDGNNQNVRKFFISLFNFLY